MDTMTVKQAHNENAFWDRMISKQAADTFYSDLFDAVVESHTEKLAALDPEYAAILEAEVQKQAAQAAFEQAYHGTLAQFQQ